MVGRHTIDLVFRTQNHRHALMQLTGLQLHDALAAVRGGTTSLFHQEAMGLASYIRRSLPGLLGLALVPGVHEDATTGRDACTSATMEAIQRMLKSLPRVPSLPCRHSSM